MEDFMEFDIVVHHYNSETERLENLGIDAPKDEKIVKYSFKATDLIELRQTYVEYEGETYDSVVVSYDVKGTCYVTPPLLVSYENFKTQYNEHYKKSIEAHQGGIL